MKLSEKAPQGKSRRERLAAHFRTGVLLALGSIAVLSGSTLDSPNRQKKDDPWNCEKSISAVLRINGLDGPLDLSLDPLDLKEILRKQLFDVVEQDVKNRLIDEYIKITIRQIVCGNSITGKQDIEKVVDTVLSGCIEQDYYIEHDMKLGLKSVTDDIFCELQLRGE